MRVFLKSSIFLIFLFFSYSVSGQYSFTSYKLKYFEEFKESVTVIPLTGNEVLDEAIKQKLKIKWKFTKLKYVNLENIQMYHREGYSIINISTFAIDGGLENTSFCLFLPHYEVNRTRMTNVIASVPIDCSSIRGRDKYTYDSECEFPQILYKLEVLYDQLIEIVNFVEDAKYKPSLAHFTGINKYVKSYNKKVIEEVRFKSEKILIIPSKVFSEKYTKEDFENDYDFKFQVLGNTEYYNAIKSNQKEYLILFFNNSPNGVINVYDIENQNTIFIDLNFANSPAPNKSKLTRLNSSQIKRLNSCISELVN